MTDYYCLYCGKPCDVYNMSDVDPVEFWGHKYVESTQVVLSYCCDEPVTEEDPNDKPDNTYVP